MIAAFIVSWLLFYPIVSANLYSNYGIGGGGVNITLLTAHADWYLDPQRTLPRASFTVERAGSMTPSKSAQEQ